MELRNTERGPDRGDRQYNVMGQLTQIASPAFTEQYFSSATQNNGQITKVVEGAGSGTETVTYQYDRLKRLIAASSTLGWSQAYGYDGFGNQTSRTGVYNLGADPTTNRLTSFTYDANGNLYLDTYTYYDVDLKW